MMRQKVWTMLGIVSVLTALTGCGGEYDGISGAGAASGGAVSGGVVSGVAVSGSAVEAEDKDDTWYQYCNKYNLYYDDFDDALIEHNLNTGKERKIQTEGLIDVLYVDEDWVYYETYAGDEVENWEKIWRAPVCKDKNWKLDEGAAELVLERELGGDGIDGEYWVDGRYIVYLETHAADGKEPLKIFDIQKKQYQADDPAMTGSIIYGVMGDFVIVSTVDGILLKNLISGSVKTLNKEPFDDTFDIMPDKKNQEIFITSSDENFELDSVWRYRLSEDKLEKLADRSQIKEVLKKEGVLESCDVCKSHTIENRGVFVRDGHLYVQLVVFGVGEVVCNNMVVVSKDLQTDAEWKWEKSLNDILHNPEENQKIFVKIGRQGNESKHIYRSRGLCTDMTEDMCLLYLERTGKGKNQFASYDFNTGKLKWLTEEDEEWWVQYYDDFWNKYLYSTNPWSVNAAMPNNF